MKIVFTEPLGVPQSTLESLLGNIIRENEVIFYQDRKEDAQTLIERCHDADAIVLTNYKLGTDVLSNCPNLKYICVAFTGYNHVDMDYCNAHDILVSTALDIQLKPSVSLFSGL